MKLKYKLRVLEVWLIEDNGLHVLRPILVMQFIMHIYQNNKNKFVNFIYIEGCIINLS